MVTRQETKLMTIGEAVDTLLKTHPDVSHSSLRFLQREGLIDPVRTRGGHRKYRPSDLERIRTIKRWQASRMSLAEIRERLERLDALPSADELCGQFLDHALAGRFVDATQLLLQAHDLGMSLTTVFQDIMTPALVEIGNRWASGEISVGQEHEVSELCRDVISELSLRHGRNAPAKTILATCVENERHDLGLRMITALLRERGAKVHFLGSDTSDRFIVESTAMRRPDVLLLSVTMADNRSKVIDVVNALRQSDAPAVEVKVLFGGQGAREWEDELPDGVMLLSSGTLDDIVDAVMKVNQNH